MLKQILLWRATIIGRARDRLPGKDDGGASLVEYALLLALIAVVAIGALTFLGGAVSNTLNNVANNLEAVGGGGGPGRPGGGGGGPVINYTLTPTTLVAGQAATITITATGSPTPTLTVGNVPNYTTCNLTTGGGGIGGTADHSWNNTCTNPYGAQFPAVDVGANPTTGNWGWTSSASTSPNGTLTISGTAGDTNGLAGTQYEFYITATSGSNTTYQTITFTIT